MYNNLCPLFSGGGESNQSRHGKYVKNNGQPIIFDVKKATFQGEDVTNLGHVLGRGWMICLYRSSCKEDVYSEERCDGFIEKRLSQIKYEAAYVWFDGSNVSSEEDMHRENSGRNGFLRMQEDFMKLVTCSFSTGRGEVNTHLHGGHVLLEDSPYHHRWICLRAVRASGLVVPKSSGEHTHGHLNIVKPCGNRVFQVCF